MVKKLEVMFDRSESKIAGDPFHKKVWGPSTSILFTRCSVLPVRSSRGGVKMEWVAPPDQSSEVSRRGRIRLIKLQFVKIERN